jgi:cardiolipin synthase
MNTQYALFTEVEPFYTTLLAALTDAQHSISMMYFTYVAGEWSVEINRILRAKCAEGVQVRLMVDELGLMVDAPASALRNRVMMRDLQRVGIQVEIFRPGGRRVSRFNRLHAKLCAVDRTTLLIGGSNIGDYYLGWQDTNLRIDGQIGDVAHRLYEYIRQYSNGHSHPIGCDGQETALNPAKLYIGDAQLLLTLPGQRQDIRRELLRLILDAENSVHIRNWYFLPDKEILNALLSQVERGVSVNVLLSDRTRIPLIDAANYIAGHKLVRSGARVLRYTRRYMHSKVAWNDQGDIVLGSANMDQKALSGCFECSLRLRSPTLAHQLHQAFENDCYWSMRQTPQTLLNRSLPHQTVSYVCSLASAWL